MKEIRKGTGTFARGEQPLLRRGRASLGEIINFWCIIAKISKQTEKLAKKKRFERLREITFMHIDIHVDFQKVKQTESQGEINNK